MKRNSWVLCCHVNVERDAWQHVNWSQSKYVCRQVIWRCQCMLREWLADGYNEVTYKAERLSGRPKNPRKAVQQPHSRRCDLGFWTGNWSVLPDFPQLSIFLSDQRTKRKKKTWKSEVTHLYRFMSLRYNFVGRFRFVLFCFVLSDFCTAQHIILLSPLSSVGHLSFGCYSWDLYCC